MWIEIIMVVWCNIFCILQKIKETGCGSYTTIGRCTGVCGWVGGLVGGCVGEARQQSL